MNKNWYAVYTRSNSEKKVNVEFEKRNIESFLPLYKRISKWTDRTKIIYEPLFKGYVFVKIDINDVLKILNIKGVVCIVGKKEKGYIAIPFIEIETIKIILLKEEKFDPYPFLKIGETVRVIKGPMKGVIGKLIRKNNVHRIVVSIDLIKQAIAIDIASDMVEVC